MASLGYTPRQAERTVLHQVVRENLETFLAERGDALGSTDPFCGSSLRLDEHAAETIADVRLRVARVTCTTCGIGRSIYSHAASRSSADGPAPVIASDEMVRILNYDPSWPARFEDERRQIAEALGSWIRGGVHHIGSTAVPGLAAKGTIDILVGIESLNTAAPCTDLLDALGYHYLPQNSEVRRFFYKPSLSQRAYHLHLVEYAGAEWHSHLAFRDFLRSHPETAQQYEDLKRHLAETHANDRKAYTDGKNEFICSVLLLTAKNPTD